MTHDRADKSKFQLSHLIPNTVEDYYAATLHGWKEMFCLTKWFKLWNDLVEHLKEELKFEFLAVHCTGERAQVNFSVSKIKKSDIYLHLHLKSV